MMLLGVDYGTRRVGLATSDTDVSLAFPLRTVTVQDDKEAVSAVITAIKEENITKVVVGMPYRMTDGGVAGETESAAQAFVAALQKQTDVPVEVEDERYTSAIAERLRRDAGTKAKNFDRDAVAAAAILETYMIRNGKI